MADANQQTILAEFCLKFFVQNFEEVSTSIGFLKLKKHLLKQALNTGNIECSAEFILHALKGWGRFQLLNQDIHCLAHNGEEKLQQFIEELLPPNTFFNYRNKMSLLKHVTNPVFA